MEVLANHIKSSSEDFKSNRAHHEALHAAFVERYDQVRSGGSQKAIETQRKRNKLLVRERIEKLIDPTLRFRVVSFCSMGNARRRGPCSGYHNRHGPHRRP